MTPVIFRKFKRAANAIAAQRRDIVITNPASMQDGFGPIRKRQKCPDDFRDYDSGSTWAEGE